MFGDRRRSAFLPWADRPGSGQLGAPSIGRVDHVVPSTAIGTAARLLLEASQPQGWEGKPTPHRLGRRHGGLHRGHLCDGSRSRLTAQPGRQRSRGTRVRGCVIGRTVARLTFWRPRNRKLGGLLRLPLLRRCAGLVKCPRLRFARRHGRSRWPAAASAIAWAGKSPDEVPVRKNEPRLCPQLPDRPNCTSHAVCRVLKRYTLAKFVKSCTSLADLTVGDRTQP
jgi:hypothetical protein